MSTAAVTGQSETLEPRETGKVSWRLLIQIGSIAAFAAALFWRVLLDMAHDWWSEPSLSQGLLLPPLALYTAWIQREETYATPAEPDRRGIGLTVFACLLFLAGRLASEFFLMRFSFVVLIAALIWTFWGRARLYTLTLPMLLLATMVPLPTLVYNSLAAPLQLFASNIATEIAQAAGTTVYRDGNVMHLAGASLGVAEACSGLNSLSALIVGSILLGYLFCSRPATRWCLFLSAIPLAIFANVIRVAGTAILADYNQEFAMGFYHTFEGWLIFVAGFGMLYLTAIILRFFLERQGTH